MLHQGNESVANRIRLGKNTVDNHSCVEPVNQLVEKGVFLPSPVMVFTPQNSNPSTHRNPWDPDPSRPDAVGGKNGYFVFVLASQCSLMVMKSLSDG